MAGGTAATTLSVATFETVVPKSLVSRARGLRPFMPGRAQVGRAVGVGGAAAGRRHLADEAPDRQAAAVARMADRSGSTAAPRRIAELTGKEPRSTQLCPPSKLASQACRVDGLGVSTRNSGTGMPSATVWLLG